MIRYLFAFLSAMMLSACLSFGESAVKVTAEISDEAGLPYSNCSIDLLVASDSEPKRLSYRKRQIRFHDKTFEQLFIIHFDRQNYIFEIICEGSNDIYLSEPLDVSAGIDNPVHLGRIVLKRNSPD